MWRERQGLSGVRRRIAIAWRADYRQLPSSR
jgi:hypothetical protein